MVALAERNWSKRAPRIPFLRVLIWSLSKTTTEIAYNTRGTSCRRESQTSLEAIASAFSHAQCVLRGKDSPSRVLLLGVTSNRPHKFPAPPNTPVARLAERISPSIRLHLYDEAAHS